MQIHRLISKTALIVLCSCILVFSQENNIIGTASDALTGEKLYGVNIIVNEIPARGTATDLDGFFRLRVPYGAYSVTASLIGYKTIIKTDVIVGSGRETNLVLRLRATDIELGEVTVQGDYFDKSIQVNNLSTVVLNAEEVRRSPGSMQDFQRILQAMPGVGFSSDMTNELLVRGGNPNENLILFDNIELHSLNHYPNEYNSGGPINMINVDLIEDIQFSSGGFNAKYGNKLSSTVIVNSREGNRNSTLDGNVNLSFAGAGGIFEGGFAGGHGSWILSARKSYLDLIIGPLGLTAVPNYHDAQMKAVYDISAKHKLSFSGIYGNDKITIEGEPDEEFPEKAGITDSIGFEYVDVFHYQFAGGVSLKSLWTKNLFSLITIYTNDTKSELTVDNLFTERNYNTSGKLASSKLLSRNSIFGKDLREGETAMTTELTWLISPEYGLNLGGSFKTGYYKSTASIDGDTARYDLNGDGIFETGPVIVPSAVITDDIKMFEHAKSYFFAANRFRLIDERLILNAGIRYDYFSYSGASEWSPRISGTWFINPLVTSINFASGIYYQTQAYPIYGDRLKSGINNNIGNTRALHYVAGIEHIAGEGLKFSLEAYLKKYSRIPVSDEFIHSEIPYYRSDKFLNAGRMEVSGVDFTLQQKLVKDYYGTLSLSYMKSEFSDPRIGHDGEKYPSQYEYPFMMTVIAGKRYHGLRTEMDKLPLFLKIPTYVLPFSDDMEISLRWRYNSGGPFTRLEYTATEQHRAGGVTWSRGTWVSGEQINADRLPAYHRLDAAINSRYNFEKWNLVIFLSFQNLYNRRNIAGYIYNSDGTRNEVIQFSLLPVAGIEAEF